MASRRFETSSLGSSQRPQSLRLNSYISTSLFGPVVRSLPSSGTEAKAIASTWGSVASRRRWWRGSLHPCPAHLVREESRSYRPPQPHVRIVDLRPKENGSLGNANAGDSAMRRERVIAALQKRLILERGNRARLYTKTQPLTEAAEECFLERLIAVLLSAPSPWPRGRTV